MNFIAVCAYSGWRQTAACSEVGRQRDQVRAGDQGWEDGHGECAEFLAVVIVWTALCIQLPNPQYSHDNYWFNNLHSSVT